MRIPIDRHIPFSRFGAYMTFSVLPAHWGHAGLVLRTMQGLRQKDTFRLELVRDGQVLDYRVTATESRCRLETDTPAWAEVCFSDVDAARIRGQGCSLRLVSIGHVKNVYAILSGPNRYRVNSPAGAWYDIRALVGELSGQWVTQRERIEFKYGWSEDDPDRPRVVLDLAPDDEKWELSVQEYMMTPRELDDGRSFEACAAESQRDFDAFADTMPELPEAYRDAGRMAMYVNYSSAIAPWGVNPRNTMLMSKFTMTSCFSWDHCFNAMAHASGAEGIAWDQLAVFFDLQEPGGCLPDCFGSGQVKWTYCKPPIHGWALGWMLSHGMEDVDREKLRWLYPRLERWTRWWLDNRDSDGDGLCEYHNGNDSGWDNSTVFDGGFPAAGPDLAGFLVMQMDTLSDLAHRLDLPGDAEAWKERADAMLARLRDRLWTGEQFVTRRAFSDEVWPKGDSLINFLPIVLGKRLPEAYRDKLAEALKPDGRFVTAHGPATESPTSEEYLSHGYWRGPIWGPETVIIVDGLWRGGYREQAAEIARRYCDMCRACGIFAENYDALTGQPLCDPAYTWGSSAYLILAHELLL